MIFDGKIGLRRDEGGRWRCRWRLRQRLACCLLGRGAGSAACCCGRAGGLLPAAGAAGGTRSRGFRGKVEGVGRLRFRRKRLFLLRRRGLGRRNNIDRDRLGGDRPNGCTSAKTQDHRQNRQMADRRCRNARTYESPWFHRTRSTFWKSPIASIAGIGAARFTLLRALRRFSVDCGDRPASIPFRRETEIGEPALGASHLGDLVHLVVGQREVEDIDIFRQPFDPRRPRYRRNILLHQPAQANLGRGLAVGLPDPRQRLRRS